MEEGWHPSWKALDDHRDTKRALLKALLEEQGHVCCYCEQDIKVGRAHVEHLEPRSLAPGRDVDFKNLLACCEREGPPAQLHCGHRKGERPLKVHPLLPDCRDFFVFTGNGEVFPVEDASRKQAAEESIRILGLSVSSLVARRRSAITGMAQVLVSLSSREEARRLLAGIDGRDSQGKNTPFASAVLGALSPRSHVSGM
jgi:uncharacterized protein (TIGR02646 family)